MFERFERFERRRSETVAGLIEVAAIAITEARTQFRSLADSVTPLSPALDALAVASAQLARIIDPGLMAGAGAVRASRYTAEQELEQAIPSGVPPAVASDELVRAAKARPDLELTPERAGKIQLHLIRARAYLLLHVALSEAGELSPRDQEEEDVMARNVYEQRAARERAERRPRVKSGLRPSTGDWADISCELISGPCFEEYDKPPGRMFRVGPHHTFGDLAMAIERHFGRWDRSHLYAFELPGRGVGRGRNKQPLRIAIPIEMERDELSALDELVLGYLSEGDEFNYEFDFGDRWLHRLKVVDDERDDPCEQFEHDRYRPEGPWVPRWEEPWVVGSWGGALPPQYPPLEDEADDEDADAELGT